MRRTKTREARRPDTAARSRRAKPISDTTRHAVVGLGASAGGLAAFESFFRAMPPDSGAAFVVIQHLDPTHQSLTAELLSKHARMPVVQVEHDTPAAPDRVYVIPPNRYLSIDNGTLRLTAPTEPRGMRMPVDLFLRSLARDQKERAVGIILSGTGTDGALGLKEIKAAGGMSMAQAPETAQYDGMPRSAILTAGVDHVLPVDRMPEMVLQYLRHAYVRRGTDAAPALADQAVDDVMPVLAILHARSKFDFRCYKKESLRRRVQRRMSLHHLTRLTGRSSMSCRTSSVSRTGSVSVRSALSWNSSVGARVISCGGRRTAGQHSAGVHARGGSGDPCGTRAPGLPRYKRSAARSRGRGFESARQVERPLSAQRRPHAM